MNKIIVLTALLVGLFATTAQANIDYDKLIKQYKADQENIEREASNLWNKKQGAIDELERQKAGEKKDDKK